MLSTPAFYLILSAPGDSLRHAGRLMHVGTAVLLALDLVNRRAKYTEMRAGIRRNTTLPMLDMARWQVLLEGERRDWRMTGVWQWPQEQGIRVVADAPPVD